MNPPVGVLSVNAELCRDEQGASTKATREQRVQVILEAGVPQPPPLHPGTPSRVREHRRQA